MAIKGKRRPRGRRVVAAPPRPQLVVRKPPIFRRRWFLISLGVLVLASSLAVTVTAIQSSKAKKLKDREAAAVGTLTQRFVAAFPTDRQVVPPNLYFFYPTLSDNLDSLGNGRLSAKDADEQAQKLLDSATKAALAIGNVGVEKLIPTSFNVSRVATAGGKGITRQELMEARFLMQRAFNLYASIPTVMKAAAEAEGAKQKALIDDAKQMSTQAADLFSHGWQILVSIQTRLGIQAPAA
jgi:hypothetical protein